jgi:hypothetical protein
MARSGGRASPAAGVGGSIAAIEAPSAGATTSSPALPSGEAFAAHTSSPKVDDDDDQTVVIIRVSADDTDDWGCEPPPSPPELPRAGEGLGAGEGRAALLLLDTPCVCCSSSSPCTCGGQVCTLRCVWEEVA